MMHDCDHPNMTTAFCPQCGEANEQCTDGERLTCIQLIKRSMWTARTTQQKHRERGRRSESGEHYAQERIASLDRKLAKLDRALTWVNAQETTT